MWRRGRAGWMLALCPIILFAVLLARCWEPDAAFSMLGASEGKKRPLRDPSRRGQGSLVTPAEADVHIADRAALSLSSLSERFALRRPLPEVVLLHVPSDKEGETAEYRQARLDDYSSSDSSIKISLLGDGAMLELEEESPSVWRVLHSEADFPPSGAEVRVFDATPAFDEAELSTGEVRTIPMRSSDSGAGVAAWNGMGGFSPAKCPRDFDGVHVTFAVWRCDGASGSCRLQQEGEDAKALVCEFGPLKAGVLQMVPGESRRFWVSSAVEDRRFGRPIPERYLPNGDLVVDLTLLGIEREAVFEYKLSEEALEMRRLHDQAPVVVAQRAMGVGFQLCAWAWMYSYYQDPTGDSMSNILGLSDVVHL